MARSRLGRAVVVTHVLIGIVLFALAALAIFLLTERALGLPLAATAAGVGTLLLPLGLAILLWRRIPALRARTRFVRLLPYVVELWALAVVGTLAGLARAPVATALARVPERFPRAGAATHSVARWAAGLITPPAVGATGATPHPPVPARDAGATTDASTPAPTPVPTPVDAAATIVTLADAGEADALADTVAAAIDEARAPTDVAVTVDASTMPDVAAASVDAVVPPAADASEAAGSSTDAGAELAGLPVCDRVLSVFPADLGHDPLDELVVGCADGVHVLWLQAGGVFERTVVAPHAPAGATVVVREPRVADANNDGRADLLVCAHWTDPQGNVTGGGLWLLPGGENGQFLAPVSVLAQGCGAADVGDVNGDGQADVVVALEGNPNATARPNGELVWLERTGGRFTPRGRTPLRRDPQRMWLADVNNDGILDVAVQHGGPGDGITVDPGSRRGPLPVDILLPIPPAPDRLHNVPARLDDDATADAVSARGGELLLRRSTGEAPRSVTRALDYARVTPP